MYLLVDLADWHYLLAQIFMGGVIGISGYTGYRLFVFDYDIHEKSRNNKSLLIVTGIFSPDIGGPATYAQTLCRELPKDGYKITLITYANEPQNKISQNDQVQIHFVNRKWPLPIRYLAYWWRLLYLVPIHDIVYVQGPVSEGLPTFLACKLANVPFYLKVVGDYAWEQGRQRSGVKDLLDEFQEKKYGFKVELWRFIEKMVARNAVAVVTPSDYLKTIVRKWGVEPEKIQVIYNSVNYASRSNNRKEALRSLGLSGDIILTVGRLVPWKGITELIDLMPSLLEHNQDFSLFIIGEGPDRSKLEKQIKDFGLERKILLLGPMAQSRLWFYMMAADMFVLNTAYEGMPHTTIEAMQIGIPVITTCIGGNPEVVTHNETGLMYKYGDTEKLFNLIIKVNEDYDIRGRIIPAARERVKDFSQKQMLEGIKEFFQKYEDIKS